MPERLAPPPLEEPSGTEQAGEGGDWPVGHVIDGQYEVRKLIGKGGMGTVYRVRHWGWNLDLAVKVPLAHLVSDRNNRERFILEAQTWIDLGVHPNIVQCWFVREWEGLPLLFLDYLPLGSLKDWRKSGRVQPGEWEKILDLMIQACSGLGHAHENGLVHRDVKPANLLLHEKDRLCVTDFGLVKVTQLEPAPSPEAATSTWPPSLPLPEDLADGTSMEYRQDEASFLSSLTLTASGTLLGTPEYGAPEQWTQARGVGTQADVYALGGILFELCCGRRAFDDGVGRVHSSLLVGRHISKPAPDPRLFNPAVPAALSDIILRCLEKRPDQRPTSIYALRESLERAYRDLTGKAYPRPAPRAGAQRADALNNKAVSLWNLGFNQRAFDAWREASKLDALHPETVYNRSISQWRQGQIDEGEVLRRLTQVKVAYPHLGAYLGYFHLDRFSPHEAAQELEEALRYPLAARNGSVWRALGDARMYGEDFSGASAAYQEALERMPDDREARGRLEMARAQTRYQNDHTRFPLSASRLVVERRSPITAVALTLDSKSVIHADEDGVEMWDLDTGAPRWRWRADHVEAGRGNIVRLGVVGDRVLSLDTPKGRVWSLETGQVQAELEGRKRFFAILPGQEAALTGVEDLEIYQLPNGPTLRALAGHAKPIACAAVSLDGRTVVTGSADRTVRVWSLETGACTRTLEGHADLVETVAISPDGTLALSGGRDRTVRVWLLSTGDCLYGLEHGDEVRRVRLTADSRYAVVSTRTLGQKDVLVVWDLASGGRVLSRPGGLSLSLLKGGPWALVGSRFARPGLLHLWELPGGRLLRSFTGHPAEVTTLATSADERWAVTGSADGSLRVWELDWASRVFELSLVVNRTYDHTEVESTHQLFGQSLDKALELCHGGDWGGAYRHLAAARQVPGYVRDPRALALNAELLSNLSRKSVKAAWQLRSFTSAGPIGAVAMTRDGTRGLSAGGKILYLWELSSGSCLRGFTGHEDPVSALTVTADGLLAISGSQGGTVRLWDLRSGDCLRVLKTGTDRVYAVAVSDDAGRLVAITQQHLYAWELTSGELTQTLDPGPFGCLSLTGDGRLALTGPALRLWDLGTGELLRGEQGFRARKGQADLVREDVTASALHVSSDGRYALSAGPDHGLRLWSLEDGVCQAWWPGHAERVYAVAMSADGRVAMSASKDGTLRIWDLAVGLSSVEGGRKGTPQLCLETLGGDAGPIRALAMTPDARFALAAGADQTLRLWEVDWELNPDAPAASLAEAWRKEGLLTRITSLFWRRRSP